MRLAPHCELVRECLDHAPDVCLSHLNSTFPMFQLKDLLTDLEYLFVQVVGDAFGYRAQEHVQKLGEQCFRGFPECL